MIQIQVDQSHNIISLEQNGSFLKLMKQGTDFSHKNPLLIISLVHNFEFMAESTLLHQVVHQYYVRHIIKF